MFYTYILKSKKDNELYIGFSSNLKERLKEHNKGLVEITKSRRPFELVYYEACCDKKKAVGREKALKTGFGRNYLRNRKNIICRHSSVGRAPLL
ncbi:GIY-YIG nuclease family protein [Candidatus Nomurabacteria bacterium]|nr:GIY-YIG nuclease family protein [Candidatus Nomurabacteria bacterium]